MRYRDSFLVGSILLSAACGRTSLGTATRDGGMTSSGGAGSTGAMTSAGGATQAIAGGTKATGGWTIAGGTQAMGGTLSVSGTTIAGGTQAAGGIPVTGGAPRTGGAPSMGGTIAGGTQAAGGIPVTGGTPPTGGTTSAGGTTSTGGTQATGDAASGTGGNTPDTSTSDLSAHLVAYYPFSGNTNDEGPNAMNGVNYGAALTSDRQGNPNSAFHFDGKAYIDISGASALNGMSSFTLSAWIDTEIVGPASVISKVTPNRDFVLDLAVTPSGSWINAQFAHFATYYHVWARQPEGMLNTWTFLTAVWTGSSWSLYINGALAGESTVVDGAVPLWTGTSFRIGSLTDGDWYFRGAIDEVRIYDRALTADEVAWVMQQ
jgi:hypothetical protein